MSDKKQDGVNDDQARYWNSAFGGKWVRHQEALDAVFANPLNALIDRAAPKAGQTVLDIGCGTGASTLAVAECVGPTGFVCGLDIAPRMLDFARIRAEGKKNIQFDVGDAQTDRLAAVDLIISRFGVMFFNDPIAAFQNILAALKPGGQLHFITWASQDENPWFQIPWQIATSHLGPLDPMPKRAPGPMAFEEVNYVMDILSRAGFVNITAETLDIPLHHPGGVEPASALAAEVGSVARVMKTYEGTSEDFKVIAGQVYEAFSKYQTANGIEVPGRFNLFSAGKDDHSSPL